jgi:hypothetical protein
MTNGGRVKTPKKEEISIVRNDRPPSSSEDGDQRTLSRAVSFDAKPGGAGGKGGSREDLLRGGGDGDEEEEDPEAEAEEDDVGRARKSGGEIDGSGIDHAGSGERRKVDMREEVVKELVKTEKKYVKDLEIIVEVCRTMITPPSPFSRPRSSRQRSRACARACACACACAGRVAVHAEAEGERAGGGAGHRGDLLQRGPDPEPQPHPV